ITLLEKCYEYNDVSSKLSECKACTALLKTLKNHQNSLNAEKISLPPPNLLEMVKIDIDEELYDRDDHRDDRVRVVNNTHSHEQTPISIQDESHLKLLKLGAPRISELPNFCRVLEQRKIDSLRVSCYLKFIFFFILTSLKTYFLPKKDLRITFDFV